VLYINTHFTHILLDAKIHLNKASYNEFYIFIYFTVCCIKRRHSKINVARGLPARGLIMDGSDQLISVSQTVANVLVAKYTKLHS